MKLLKPPTTSVYRVVFKDQDGEMYYKTISGTTRLLDWFAVELRTNRKLLLEVHYVGEKK